MKYVWILLLVSCGSQDFRARQAQLATYEANAGANHLMRLQTECVEVGYSVIGCPHVERIDRQMDEEWAACQR